MTPSLSQSDPAQTSRSYASFAFEDRQQGAIESSGRTGAHWPSVTLKPLKPAIFTAETIFM